MDRILLLFCKGLSDLNNLWKRMKSTRFYSIHKIQLQIIITNHIIFFSEEFISISDWSSSEDDVEVELLWVELFEEFWETEKSSASLTMLLEYVWFAEWVTVEEIIDSWDFDNSRTLSTILNYNLKLISQFFSLF